MTDDDRGKRTENRAYLNTVFLSFYLEDMRGIARKHGYALAVHGSLIKDVDLVGVPWVEEAASPDELAEALREVLCANFATNMQGDPQPEGERPHGRRSWSIVGGCIPTWVDLSVMPPTRQRGDE